MASLPQGRRLPVVGSPGDPVREHIDDAKSHDLIFAVVGYMGAGAGWVAHKLADELRKADYQPRIISLSKLIKETALELDVAQKTYFDGNPCERTEALQLAGSRLCERFGLSFLAGLAIRKLHTERTQARSPADKHSSSINSSAPRKSKRSATCMGDHSTC